MPLPAGAAVLAGTVSKVADVAGDIGGALGFSDTATDKRRKASALQKLNLALAGDTASLRQLQYEAFEKRSGAPGDVRTPVDGKYSPDDVRDLAMDALRKYYKASGDTPPAQYAAKLKLPPAPPRPNAIVSALDSIAQPILERVGEAAVDVAAQRAGDKARSALPWVAAAVVGVVLVVIVLKRSR
jgi:hypothetical protein